MAWWHKFFKKEKKREDDTRVSTRQCTDHNKRLLRITHLLNFSLAYSVRFYFQYTRTDQRRIALIWLSWHQEKVNGGDAFIFRNPIIQELLSFLRTARRLQILHFCFFRIQIRQKQKRLPLQGHLPDRWIRLEYFISQLGYDRSSVKLSERKRSSGRLTWGVNSADQFVPIPTKTKNRASCMIVCSRWMDATATAFTLVLIGQLTLLLSINHEIGLRKIRVKNHVVPFAIIMKLDHETYSPSQLHSAKDIIVKLLPLNARKMKCAIYTVCGKQQPAIQASELPRILWFDKD
jgi:hypothetical protein